MMMFMMTMMTTTMTMTTMMMMTTRTRFLCVFVSFWRCLVLQETKLPLFVLYFVHCFFLERFRWTPQNMLSFGGVLCYFSVCPAAWCLVASAMFFFTCPSEERQARPEPWKTCRGSRGSRDARPREAARWCAELTLLLFVISVYSFLIILKGYDFHRVRWGQFVFAKRCQKSLAESHLLGFELALQKVGGIKSIKGWSPGFCCDWTRKRPKIASQLRQLRP